MTFNKLTGLCIAAISGSVDAVLAGLEQTLHALEATAAKRAKLANKHYSQAAKLEAAGDRHTAESERAARVASKLRKLVE